MNQSVQQNDQLVERRSVERDNQWGKRNSTGVVIASSMSFENISYQTGDNDILKDISLNVEPGEVLCLLGPSGSGKTTLLRIAAGLIEEASGSIKIDGRTIADDKTFIPPDKRGVGLVFQDYALLMDEPFSGLDSRLRDSIREQTIDLLRETRSTAIIVTHDAEEALRVGDHVALIQDGKLVQYGEAKDLYYRPTNLFAAGFFSEINVIPATCSNGVAKTVFGECPCDEALSDTGCAAIRLADIDVKPYDAALKGVMGRVSMRRFIGTSELLEINVENLDEPLSVRIKAGELSDNIKLVSLNVDPKCVMIFPV